MGGADDYTRVVLTMIDKVADLEKRARNGEASAFGQLARMYDRDLRNVVWSVLRSPQMTDDVMQSAYERAFRNIGSFDGRSSVKTWLSSVCYRTAIDHIRYEGRRRHPSMDDENAAVSYDMSAASGGDLAVRVVDREQLSQAMAQLSADEAAILTMTAGLGYSYDEVASIMDIARGTVASRASRARRRLQQELER